MSDVGPKTAVLLMDRTELKAVVNSDNECLKLWATLKMVRSLAGVLTPARNSDCLVPAWWSCAPLTTAPPL